MQFRCPNCRQPVNVADQTAHLESVPAIECPSCHSRFSLSEEVAPAVVPPEGMQIAHFDVHSILGEGGFGTVYRAWDRELKRHVAVKVPRESGSGPGISRQMMLEARAAASVRHPNVVSVYEVGVHKDRCYIVSELIEGTSLTEYRRNRDVTPQDAARILIRILRAVQVFHDRGMVHRDLKPANILMDETGEPHVTDFGLVKYVQPNELTVTADGKVMGTLHYMPPEQAAGNSAGISTRTDIYSLGVVLYELLTGKRPFELSSSHTLLYSIMYADPPAPRSVSRQIPAEMETICLKAMSKDAAHRYQSASEFADDLQRFLNGQPILARPVSILHRTRKWILRNKATTTAIAALLIAAVALAFAFRQPPLPEGTIPVVIGTSPPADEIRFELYDDALLIPHPSAFTAETVPDAAVPLRPGFYKVTARTADGHFHEVWRTVPEEGTDARSVSVFPHHHFRVSEHVCRLPAFRLFRDDEVPVPVVRLAGSTFTMGADVEIGDLAPAHQHPVESFCLGVNEVSWGSFRSVLSVPADAVGQRRTFLDLIFSRYGDRSDEPDNMPVSGYPVDVARLYCELSGTTLPTHAEYEYAATVRGTQNYPTGNTAAVTADERWTVIPVDSATPDTTPDGIRNLYHSLSEYTDSQTAAYVVLYPDLFPDRGSLPPIPAIPQELRAALSQSVEIRGAPQDWITNPDAELTTFGNVRDRLRLPYGIPGDREWTDHAAQVGWRTCRRSAPTVVTAEHTRPTGTAIR